VAMRRESEHKAKCAQVRADDDLTRLRAAGEEALYQLVIVNGNWASEAPGLTDGWRIDTSEAIASLKAVLPVPPVDAPAQQEEPTDE
jgi:L-fucose mutarotase/ribose pyranase (RbsD/FucU family)